MQTDRVVFDTNVYVQLILNENLEELIFLSTRHKVQIFTCKKQIEELLNVLDRDKIKSKLKSPAQDYVELILLVTTSQEIDERFDRVEDLKDNYLVDLAYTVKSFYIVSGDRHLTSLKHVGRIQIVAPSYFKKFFR